MSFGASALQRARTQAGGVTGATPPAAVTVPGSAAAEQAPVGAAEPAATPVGEVTLDLVTEVSENVAVLNVFATTTAGGASAYSIVGANPKKTLPAGVPRGRPRVALADLAQGENPATMRRPSQILAVMYEWSMENRDVARWIGELRGAVGDIRLVIMDHTGYELPWELLWLPPKTRAEQGQYLGVAVATARWQTVVDSATFEDVKFECGEAALAGGVVGYIDAEGLHGGGRQEHAALERLGGKLEERLTGLTEGLSVARDDVALVYVATHGHYAKDVLDFGIGTPGDDYVELAVLREKKRLPTLEQSALVVFLNVCHSGRLFEERESVIAQWLRGFPEVFLGHGAKGVIATTGWVDDAYASEMAAWVFDRLSGHDVPAVADVLREWRERVASEPASSERDKLRLLTAFMYVYYGNPSITLTIAAGGDG